MNLKNIKPDIRYLKDMKNVVCDKEWLKKAPRDLEMYYIYRGVREKGGLRYDITIIPSKVLGKEFVKTKGHQHSAHEIYNILKGKAIFLIQNCQKKIIKDIYAIKAKQGDVITIPPNFGHIVINPSNQELQLGNWISENCKNDYRQIEKMKGAGYFYTKGPAKGEVNWIKNTNYKKIPKLHFEKP